LVSELEVDRFPPYYGPAWDEKIGDRDHPNFWKYGVANLVFLDYVGEKRVILDVGCGTGGSTLFLAERGRAELLIGVDVVKSMVRVAKTNAVEKRLSAKTDFVVCDGRYLPFKPSCFDSLVSRGDAFCFLVPLKDAVHEFRRVLSHHAIVVIEVDNRTDWKPGSIVSTGFQKMTDGRVAYLVEVFDSGRNHTTTYHVLDVRGRIVKEVSGDAEFVVKGHKKCEYPLSEVAKETVETRQGVRTHWPTVTELRYLFTGNGYKDVEIRGAGLLMKLMLDGEKAIVNAMKRQPQLFFRMEHDLIDLVDPEKSPTIILKAVKG
jgi:ubiquinone/menaquinone biosynthesis C-methylase UbiE